MTGKCCFAVSLAFSILASAPTLPATENFYGKLASPCRVLSAQLPLKTVTQRIGESHELNVWLDRRIDPTMLVNLSVPSGSVQQVLEVIAAQIDAELGFADPVVIIAPKPEAVDTATRILMLRSQMRSGQTASSGLSKLQDLQWERLSTPAEVVEQISATWNLSLAGDTLPHDLWDQHHLRQIDAAAAMVLVSAGFEQAPVYDQEDSVFRFEPFQQPRGAAVDYPASKLSPAVVSQLRKIDPNFKLQRNAALVRVTGSSAVHHRIRSLGGEGAVAKREETMADLDPAAKRFTLRITGVKPADAILRALCGASGFELDAAAADPEKLRRNIGLDVEDMPVTEIIASVCEQVGPATRFEAAKVIVVDRP